MKSIFKNLPLFTLILLSIHNPAECMNIVKQAGSAFNGIVSHASALALLCCKKRPQTHSKQNDEGSVEVITRSVTGALAAGDKNVKSIKELREISLMFDRTAMVPLHDDQTYASNPKLLRALVEGYWSNPSDRPDKSNDRFPFPQKYAQPWPQQKEFLEKLKAIEATAKTHYEFQEKWVEKEKKPLKIDDERYYTPRLFGPRADEIWDIIPPAIKRKDYTGIILTTQRGPSFCRFNNTSLGCREYEFQESRNGQIIEPVIVWPEDFGTHYIEKFNVKPSKAFFDFVMNYQLPQKPLTAAAAATHPQ